MTAQLASTSLWPATGAARSTKSPSLDLEAELKALGAHASHCRHHQGRMFAVYSAAEAVHAFVAPRFVTTLVAAMAVLGIGVFVF